MYKIEIRTLEEAQKFRQWVRDNLDFDVYIFETPDIEEEV